MKNKPALIKVIFLIFFALSACFDDDCCPENERIIRGEGSIQEFSIDLSEFKNISNTGIMQLNIEKGNQQKVTIRAQENLFEELSIEVKNKELIIDTRNKVGLHTNIGLFGDIIMTNNPENIQLVGTGDVSLKGEKQSSIQVNMIGTGNFKAFALEVDHCVIHSTGTGNCQVWANETLDVTLTGTGNVYYKGSPIISQANTGLGSIINSN